MQNADGRRSHSPYALAWTIPRALYRKGSFHPTLWSVAKRFVELPQSTELGLLMNWQFKGSNKRFCVFFPGKKNFNSGILMNPLWKLKSKIVIHWVTTTLEWQNREIQREMMSRIQICSQKLNCHNSSCMRAALPQYLSRSKTLAVCSLLESHPSSTRLSNTKSSSRK